MEKYEKPCMEVVEIEKELTTAPCNIDGCGFDIGGCSSDIGIKS